MQSDGTPQFPAGPAMSHSMAGFGIFGARNWNALCIGDCRGPGLSGPATIFAIP
jgi:hypothetical protein